MIAEVGVTQRLDALIGIVERITKLLPALGEERVSSVPEEVGAGGNGGAAGERIDTLSNVVISNPVITGGSVPASSIVGTVGNAITTALGEIDTLTSNSITAVNASTSNLAAANASITNLSLGSGPGFLTVDSHGNVVATSSVGAGAFVGVLSPGSGGTGITAAPAYGQILLGNGTGYSLVATSSLGFPTLASFSASAPLSYNTSTGAFSLQQANTSQNGFLSAADWNTFSGKLGSSSLSASYPLLYNGSGSFSLGFGTTTSNTWSGTNAFSGNVVMGSATTTNFFATTASSTNLFAQSASLGSVTTSGNENILNEVAVGTAAMPGLHWLNSPPYLVGVDAKNAVTEYAISPYGTYGSVAAVRSSDNTSSTLQNIIADICVIGSDNALIADLTWCRYEHGVVTANSAFYQHINDENSVNNQNVSVLSDPFTTNPAHSTYNLRLDSGTGSAGNNVTAALDIINNGGQYNSGIIFGSTALAMPSAGMPDAIALAPYQALSWYYGAGAKAWQIYSTSTSASGNLNIAGNGNVVFPNASIGIGTTSPDSSLTINAATPQLDFQSSTNARSFYIGEPDGFNGILNQIGGGNIQFKTNGTALLTLVGGGVGSYFNTGNVGIGTSAPNYLLDVAGLGHFTGLVDAANFVATSSSATSLFNGNLVVNGNATTTNLFAQSASLGSLTATSLGVGIAPSNTYVGNFQSTSGRGGLKIQTWSSTATSGDAENVQLYGVSNRTTNTGNFWNMYSQLNVLAGAAIGGGESFDHESTVENYNPATYSSPFSWNMWGGTVNYRADCGGATNCDHAIDIINNSQPYETGILIGANSLATSTLGNPPALSMPATANGYSIAWYRAGSTYSSPAWQIYANSTAKDGNSLVLGDSLASISVPFAITANSGTSTIAAGQGFTIGGSQFLVQQGSGNVGVGTTSPDQLLAVNGNIDIAAGNSYNIGDLPILYASSSLSNIALGYLAGAATTTTGTNDIAIGYKALLANTSGVDNVAVGYQALKSNTTGAENNAVGRNALIANLSGWDNNAFGRLALSSNNSGSNNVAFGSGSLGTNVLGSQNSAFGSQSLTLTTAGNNSAFGYQAGSGDTTGANNIFIGFNSASTTQTGSNNIAIGFNIALPSVNGSNQLDIGNLIYGTGINGQYGNLSTGNIGIGTTTPYSTLEVWGPDAAASTAFSVVNNASTTVLDVLDNGSIGIGTTTPDTLLTLHGATPKMDFYSTTSNRSFRFGMSDGYNGTLAVFGTGAQISFTANGASLLTLGGSTSAYFPSNVGVGTSSASSRLTVWGPDTASTTAFSVVNNASTTVFASYDNGNATYSGSLFQSSDQRLKTNISSLNASSSLSLVDQLNPVSYTRIDQPDQGSTLGFIAQEVQKLFPNLVTTTAATALTPGGTLTLNYTGLIAPLVAAVQALQSEIAAIQGTVAGFAQSITSVVGNFGTLNSQRDNTQTLCIGSTCVTEAQLKALLAASNAANTGTPGGDTSTGGVTSGSSTPPIIQVNGNNPAIISVGATYQDIGATITGPAADINLDIRTFVNGSLMNPVSIDTSAAATDTIEYVVSDQNGLTSTSTRTVIIQAAQQAPDAASTSNATTTSANGVY